MCAAGECVCKNGHYSNISGTCIPGKIKVEYFSSPKYIFWTRKKVSSAQWPIKLTLRIYLAKQLTSNTIKQELEKRVKVAKLLNLIYILLKSKQLLGLRSNIRWFVKGIRLVLGLRHIIKIPNL